MKMKTLFIVVLLIIAVGGFTSHRETIGEGEVGVRNILGYTTVFQAGETLFLPAIGASFLKMSTKPVNFTMAGVGTISIPDGDAKKISIDCKVQYQVEEAGPFIKGVGMDAPDREISERIRTKITDVFSQRQLKGELNLDDLQSRLLLTAELLYDLNDEALTPGVKVLSFELLEW